MYTRRYGLHSRERSRLYPGNLKPENNHDRHAVCVKKGIKIVGHDSSLGVSLALLFVFSILKLSSQFHVSRWPLCWNATSEP